MKSSAGKNKPKAKMKMAAKNAKGAKYSQQKSEVGAGLKPPSSAVRG